MVVFSSFKNISSTDRRTLSPGTGMPGVNFVKLGQIVNSKRHIFAGKWKIQNLQIFMLCQFHQLIFKRQTCAKCDLCLFFHVCAGGPGYL
jgi:hypothetical protein